MQRRVGRTCAVLAAGWVWACGSAHAQDERAIGRDEVIELARDHSLDVQVAARAVAASRALRVGADVLLRANPELQVGAGPRFRQMDTLVDASATLSIPLEIYGVRDAEIVAGERAIDRDLALVDASRREAIREALHAYYAVLRAMEDVRWTREQRDAGERFLAVAARRREVGEIGEQEIATARILAASAVARAVRARGEQSAATARLTFALGALDEERTTVTGTLRDARVRYDAALATAPPEREPPALVAAEQAIEAARARLSADERRAWPVPIFHATYEREEGEDVAFFSLSIPLPFFQRNQGAIALGHAELARLEAQRDLVEARIRSARAVARARYRAALEAVTVLEAHAVPELDSSLQMVRRAFELGATDLPDLLTVQRELAITRGEYFDALLALAQAGVDLEIALGRLQ